MWLDLRENDRLKRVVSELTWDKLILKEALRENTKPLPEAGVRRPLRSQLEISERRAVLGQPRSTQRQYLKTPDDLPFLSAFDSHAVPRRVWAPQRELLRPVVVPAAHSNACAWLL